jgi:acetyltransferase-like isoleucine patch superfamily enzyme
MKNTMNQEKERSSARSNYKRVVTGDVSFFYFMKYELVTMLFSGFPGYLGMVFRRFFFRSFFRKIGKNVWFGRNMVIRYAGKIEIGDNVVFEDNVVLDGNGESEGSLKIAGNVIVGRNTSISCRGGEIEIGDNCSFGSNNIIVSESILRIGNYVFTAGNASIIAGGNHLYDRKDVPIRLQPVVSRGGIIMDDDIWIGASSTILDGVRIGKGAVIGAASLVNKRIRPYTVNVGIPSQTIKKRE